MITTNGVSQFRKGLDVSGGTRLIYRISYDKYESIYTNATELAAVKSTIETIILKNIDKRISKLGVSDYKAYVQKLDNQNYIVVEIGGIADLDTAKEIIGKTLELEFRLQNKDAVTSSTIAKRKEIAQTLFANIKKEPDLMTKLVDGRMSENIFLNYYSGATLDQLPEIYKTNISKIDALKAGDLYNGILEGTYTTVTSQDQLGNTTGVTLKGFNIVRLIEKEETTISGKVEKTYSLLDVFVQDRQNWIQAIDDKGNALNGAYFKFANTSTSQVGEPVVAINFDDKGKEIFCNLTEKNIGNPMAIFVGGQLLTSPTIQAKICGGTAQIDGSFTIESAKELSNNLND
ncbi:TPA: hypothetical protein DEP21_01140 [Patescibacteria group bacterium]|nr:hypothetical protein [Candidatus Gracilibacteria bacterium]